MKLSINKHLKTILIIIVVIIIGVFSLLMYRALRIPHFKEEKVTLYNYNNKGNVNYTVFLKPNILYENESIGQGEIYITEFINDINTSFIFEFSGDSTADIKGNYEIIGTVEGYTGEGESLRTIWRKKFILFPKTNFNAKDKVFLIKQEIPIKLNQYNDFAENVIKDSKIVSNVKLTASMNVNLKANTDKGTIEEKMSPSMVIPLNTSYFEITGNLSEEKPGTIEETKQVQLPVDKNKVIMYGIILGVSLILLFFLIFFTKVKPILDPIEKTIKKIFKKYGDRLVALNNEIAVTCESYSEVKSIEDLVRIADEIEKPIMYKHSLDYKKISKFYVNDDTQMYIFDLSKIVIDKNLNNRKKDKSQDDVNKLKNTISQIKASKLKKKETGTETTES